MCFYDSWRNHSTEVVMCVLSLNTMYGYIGLMCDYTRRRLNNMLVFEIGGQVWDMFACVCVPACAHDVPVRMRMYGVSVKSCACARLCMLEYVRCMLAYV